jgi:hypothetical protein
MTTAAFSRSTRAARRPWLWALALLALMLAAPLRADLACSGADAEVARPIAATLQAHASVFDLAGSFEVTLRSSPEPTSEIDLRHVMGSKVLFRTVTKVKADLETVTVERLPAREGLGFALCATQGGSGCGEVCTSGFRFQNGVVFYHTLAAKGVDRRDRKTFAGAITEWKPALNTLRR